MKIVKLKRFAKQFVFYVFLLSRGWLENRACSFKLRVVSFAPPPYCGLDSRVPRQGHPACSLSHTTGRRTHVAACSRTFPRVRPTARQPSWGHLEGVRQIICSSIRFRHSWAGSAMQHVGHLSSVELRRCSSMHPWQKQWPSARGHYVWDTTHGNKTYKAVAVLLLISRE